LGLGAREWVEAEVREEMQGDAAGRTGKQASLGVYLVFRRFVLMGMLFDTSMYLCPELKFLIVTLHNDGLFACPSCTRQNMWPPAFSSTFTPFLDNMPILRLRPCTPGQHADNIPPLTVHCHCGNLQPKPLLSSYMAPKQALTAHTYFVVRCENWIRSIGGG
jgi:hypothetical protein